MDIANLFTGDAQTLTAAVFSSYFCLQQVKFMLSWIQVSSVLATAEQSISFSFFF